MNREEKNAIIEDLTNKLNATSHFYLTDISELNAEKTSNLRRMCYKNEIKLVVVKNTLLKSALEKSERNFEELYETLVGPTSVMFAETGNAPGKLIKEFRKKNNKPVLKAAYVEESFYIGDEQIDALANIKSKDELIADLVALLQSPMQNLMSQMQSGANNIHGVLKTLSEKN
jgi:large subunit ribosomal protein L10